MKSSEVLVLILVIMLLYIMVSDDDPIAQPYLTLQNKCELALRNQHDISKYVIEQCKKLLKKEEDDE